MEKEKDLEYWKNNAEEDYLHVPISVLRYITVLEQAQPQDKEKFLKAAEVEAEKRCPMPYAKEVTFMQSVDNKNVVYNRKELVKMAQWAYETLTKKQK